MGKVKIDTLEPGMVLAADLFHVDGRLILSKGLNLTPKHLRVLKMWGVASAEIEGVADSSPAPALGEIDPVLLQKAEELTRKQFTHAPVDHPLLSELFRICTLRRAQRMALQNTSGPEGEATDLEIAPAPVPKFIRPDAIRHKDIAALLDRDVALASLPHIFAEVNQVISDPRSSAIHVANVISKDPNLATRLLRCVFRTIPDTDSD
jgi:hypothetical protein